MNNVLKIIRNKNIKNLSGLFLEKIATLSFSFLFIYFLAKKLGPEKLGMWSYAVSIVSIISILSSLGLRGIIIRDLNFKKKNTLSILGSSWILLFIGGLLALGFSVFVVLILGNEIDTVFLVAILASKFLFTSVLNIRYFFESNSEFKNIIIATIIAVSTAFFIKIYFIYKNYSLAYIAGTVVFETFLTSLILLFFYQKNNNIKQWEIRKKTINNILKDGLPLIFSSLLMLVYMKSDQIMLKELSTVKEVGFYSLAARLVEIWFFFPIIFNTMFYPKLTKIFKKNKTKFNVKLRDYLRLMVLFSILIISLYLLASEFIINMVFGKTYITSAKIIKILCFSLLFVSIETGRVMYINLYNITSYQLKTVVIGVIINIFLNLILIPLYGAYGAAIASVFSQFISVLFLCFVFKKLNYLGKEILLASLTPFKVIKKLKKE